MRAFEVWRAMTGSRVDEDRGAAMAEYALLIAGIAIVVGASAALLGGRLTTLFGTFFP